jgi:hypothetical protein
MQFYLFGVAKALKDHLDLRGAKFAGCSAGDARRSPSAQT